MKFVFMNFPIHFSMHTYCDIIRKIYQNMPISLELKTYFMCLNSRTQWKPFLFQPYLDGRSANQSIAIKN